MGYHLKYLNKLWSKLVCHLHMCLTMFNKDYMFFEEITKWVDEGSPVDIIYLKAFDEVPHKILKLKLNSHGIGISIMNWIEQWLTAMRQMVVVDGEVSNWKYVLINNKYI